MTQAVASMGVTLCLLMTPGALLLLSLSFHAAVYSTSNEPACWVHTGGHNVADVTQDLCSDNRSSGASEHGPAKLQSP